MTDSAQKKLLLNSIGYTEQSITQDVYKLNDGNIVYVKVSKIHDGGNYWYTLNKKNILNFDEFNINEFIFSGPKGYYRIPIHVLKDFLDNYKEVPKDNKYHFGIYPDKHMIERNKENALNIKEFYHDLPDSLKNAIQQEEDSENSFDDRNYFSYNSTKNGIKDKSPSGNEEFVFDGIYINESISKINDIVFFTQHGDRPTWDPGLSAICKLSKEPYDKGYWKEPKKEKYFKVKLTPLYILPKVLDREDFMGYFDCYDIPFIGPKLKNEANQANQHISKQQAQNIVGVLLDYFPEDIEIFKEIFGHNFSTRAQRATIGNNPNGQEPSLSFTNIKINPISDEPHNLILYGAPGTGKSFELKSRIEGGTKKHSKGLFPNEELRKRITFHPNYSYRNFVGSYKPKPIYREGDTDKKYYDSSKKESNQSLEPLIEYVFEAGPLLEMYVKAHHNPDHNFVIIIEELNRANPAAVFGDMFQLLDRKDGVSEYPITLEPAANDYLISKGIDSGQIALPSNLYLWATMNNADQGVMPMDSAFKRRWSFEYMALDENEKEVKDQLISFPWGTTIKWNKFRDKINTELIGLNINEDKLIGPFFLKEEELENPKAILNKLLLYLKDDVLKYNSGIFKKELKTFSKIVESYNADKNVFEEKLGLDKVDSIEA